MLNVQIDIEDKLRKAVPNLLLGDIVCSIENTRYSADLWLLIKQYEEELRQSLKIEEVKQVKSIHATRLAYKACGKDPNRYRPSAEQLNRRILQGKELYQVSTVVDLINLVSLKSGYSIGGFDFDKVKGSMRYGIGEADEAYEGIGRGKLNVEGLPVLRDESGGIGTPTSDEVRTMISNDTSLLLMNINAFDGDKKALEGVMHWSVDLLFKFAKAKILAFTVIS